MFPTRDEDKRPSRPTGSWWPVRWRFPSWKQVVLVLVVTCALLPVSRLLAVVGSIASLGTVAVEDSLLVEAVKTFSSRFISSSAGSGAGGAWLPVAAMSYFINLKFDSLKTELGSEVDSKTQRSLEELGIYQQSLDTQLSLLDEVDVTLDVSAELP